MPANDATEPENAGDSNGTAYLIAGAAIFISVGTAPAQPDLSAVSALIALTLTGLGLALAASTWARRCPPRALYVALVAGISLHALILISAPPVSSPLFAGGAAAAGLVGVAGIALKRVQLGAVILAVVLQCALAAWMVASMTPDDNDVYFFHQDSLQAVVTGQNPYVLQFPNIYGLGTPLYAPEVQQGDHVTFGFPYPPMSLLMALPGYLAFGDYRYAAVVAAGLTALLVYLARPGKTGAGAALLLVTSPLTFRVLHYGWTEPFVGVGFALTAFAALRWPRALPFGIGFFLAIKQYLAPTLVIAFVVLRRARRTLGWKRLLIIPPIVAAATVIPLLLASPEEFLFSVVYLQALQPFRIDSASLPGLIARAGGPELPIWIAFAGAASALAFAAWQAPRTLAGFCAASAFVFLGFFVLSKQAFMNYYYFAFVTLCCAVGFVATKTTDPQP